MAGGCEPDEFADAPRATATSSDGERAGEGASTQPSPSGGSAGPIQGQDRPPGHPTLDGDSAGGSAPAPGQQMEAAGPAVERPTPEEYGQAGPILWEAPSQWEPRQQTNDMRFAEYAMDSDEGTAEVVVFYFGPGGAGGVDANLDRWASQLQGGPQPIRATRDVEGMTVHTLDAAGTYHTDMPMGGATEPMEDQRLLGAIAEASAGLFFFRMLGDEAVVTSQEEAFDEFVDSLTDAS